MGIFIIAGVQTWLAVVLFVVHSMLSMQTASAAVDPYWAYVGGRNFSQGTAGYPTLAFDLKDNTPYLGYRASLPDRNPDILHGWGFPVFSTFDGSTWQVDKPLPQDLFVHYMRIFLRSDNTKFMIFANTAMFTDGRYVMSLFGNNAVGGWKNWNPNSRIYIPPNKMKNSYVAMDASNGNVYALVSDRSVAVYDVKGILQNLPQTGLPNAGEQAMTIGANGDPVLFIKEVDNQNVGSLYQYSKKDLKWNLLSEHGFAPSSSDELTIASHTDGTVYTAFQYIGMQGRKRLRVDKIAGDSRSLLMQDAAGGTLVDSLRLVVDRNGVPHIVFRDVDHGLRLVVKRWDATVNSFVSLSSTNFVTESPVTQPDLAFDLNNVPYITYADSFVETRGRASVIKYVAK